MYEENPRKKARRPTRAKDESASTGTLPQTLEALEKEASGVEVAHMIEGVRLSERAEDAFRYAISLARAAKRERVDSLLLFSGFLTCAEAKSMNDAASFVLNWLRQRAPTSLDFHSLVLIDHLFEQPDRHSPIERYPDVLPGEILERDARAVLARAEELARHTDEEVGTARAGHLLVALLMDPSSPVPGALTQHGYPVRQLRTGLLTFLSDLENVYRKDPAIWRKLLSESEPWAPTEHVAGFSSDVLADVDQLGITNEVHALCSVLVAKSVQPPLSLGLFGDWGTGKSFFMKEMERRIRALSSASREARGQKQPTEYCSNVVQIRFNAWHYLDTNLWASLVARIFEGLSTWQREGVGDRTVDPLDAALARSKAQAADAAARLAAATEAKKSSDERLLAIQAERAKAEKQRSTTKGVASQLYRFVANSPELQPKLQELAKQLGLSELDLSPEGLQRRKEEVKGLAGHVRSFWRWLRQPERRTRRLFFLLVLLGTFAGLTFLVLPSLGIYAPELKAFAAAASAVLTWLVAAYVQGEQLIGKLTEAQTRMDRIFADERNPILGALNAVEAKEKEANAKAAQALAAAEKGAQEVQLVNRLSRFIEEQDASSHIRSQLGFISTIRGIFERLTELLHESSKSDTDGQAIDRIILYIDDLDRCSESRVVEVLQAVHLLLSFKLFVVVVAVDSRWLLQALKKEFPGLADSSASRPQNYLEKIFQIPFNLRRMESDGYSRLLDSLVTVKAAPQKAEAPPAQSGDGSKTAPPIQANGNGMAPVPAAPVETAPAARAPSVPPALNLQPRSLELDACELDFMKKLVALIRSPRATKRLVNTYRLLRASVEEDDVPSYVEGEYRAVLLLLAILVGFPTECARLFSELAQQSPTTEWWQFFDKAKATPKDEEPQLKQVLKPLRSEIAGPVGPFQKWAPRVARFSFHAFSASN